MNQEQITTFLLSLDPEAEPFTLILSGKASKKVNGLYHPDKREIVLHNKNFTSDGELLYTAIHEFAHHLHFTRSRTPVGPRAHTAAFRRILHRLLSAAEEKGLWSNPYSQFPDLDKLTREIREKLLKASGETAVKLGEALRTALGLCQKHGIPFADYVERVLQFDGSAARTFMTLPLLQAPAALGSENLKLIASRRNPQVQQRLAESLGRGLSRDLAREAAEEAQDREEKTPPPPPAGEEGAARERLLKEKQRLERTIRDLSLKLAALNRRLSALDRPGGRVPTK
ncbi:MAG: hypothetical protein LBQ61_09260 [Spirochaetales bacterium]|jgi:hypothetical protein|nr:hypothetical protein [Spirochaetales bacterium]